MELLFELYKMPKNHGMHWPRMVLFLLRRIIEYELLIIMHPKLEIHPANADMSA